MYLKYPGYKKYLEISLSLIFRDFQNTETNPKVWKLGFSWRKIQSPKQPAMLGFKRTSFVETGWWFHKHHKSDASPPNFEATKIQCSSDGLKPSKSISISVIPDSLMFFMLQISIWMVHPLLRLKTKLLSSLQSLLDGKVNSGMDGQAALIQGEWQ